MNEDVKQKLCECGCGDFVSKATNRFILGHIGKSKENRIKLSKRAKEQWKDEKYRKKWKKSITKKNNTDEFKKMKSRLSKELWQNPDYRKKVIKGIKKTRKIVAKKMKEHWANEEYRKRELKKRLGKKHTEETKKKIAKLRRLPEARKKVSEQFKKKWQDPEYRKKMAKSMKKAYSDPKFKELRSEQMRKQWEDPELRRKRLEGMNDPEAKRKQSEAMRAHWKDPGHISKMKKAWHTSPTSYEWKIIELCFTHRLGFIYVGDFQKCINGKFPDFINENKKQIIETYTIYFKIEQHGSEQNFRTQRKKDINGYDIIFLNDLDITADDWRERCLFKIKNHKLCEHPKYWDETKYEKEAIAENLRIISS